MLAEACAGAVVIACAIAIIHLLTRAKGPVTIDKRQEGGSVRLRVRANRDIRKLEVRGRSAEGEIFLVRKGLAKGEEVEFSFPIPQGRVTVLAEDESGARELEV